MSQEWRFRPLPLRQPVVVLVFLGLIALTRSNGLAQEAELMAPGTPVATVPGQVGAFQTNLLTGAATYSFPLKLPPGRNGLQPKLTLDYNSDRGYGWIGMGWELTGLGAIERSTKRGVPRYDGTDTYTLTINGTSQELVADSAGTYHTQIESFLRIRYDQPGDAWIVTDTNGTQYRFGGDDTRVQSSPGSNKTAVWLLDLISDTHCGQPPCDPSANPGNSVRIFYAQDHGYPYPESIHYTLGDSSLRRVKVQFVTIDDLQGARDSYRLGMQVARTRRLARIEILMNYASSNFLLERGYEFSYQSADGTGNGYAILLDRIEERGFLGQRGLPPTRFEYGPAATTPSRETRFLPYPYDPGANSPPAIPTIAYFINQTLFSFRRGIYLIDADGDGKTELLTQYYGGYTGTYNTWYYRSSRDPQGQLVLFGTFPSDWDEYYGERIKPIFGDLNGDRLIDVLFVYPRCTPNPAWAALNQDGQLGPVQLVGDIIGGTRGYLVDIDGDGRDDYVHGGCSDSNLGYYPSHVGAGSTLGSRVDLGPIDGLTAGTDWVPGDLNGDGLADLVAADCPCEIVGNPNRRYYPNIGAKFSTSVPTPIPLVGQEAGIVRVADVNRDGVSDFLYVGFSGERHWDFRTVAGSAFSSEVVSSVGGVFLQASSAGTRIYELIGDMTGDGVPEVVWWYNEGGCTLCVGAFLAGGFSDGASPFPSLRLTKITNSMGGVTSIGYEALPGTGGAMPMSKWVVKSITTNDGVGVLSTTDYSYSGAQYSGWPRNEFRGFAAVTVTDPPDHDDLRHATVTSFHQDDARKGLIDRIERVDSAGVPYWRTVYEYAVSTPFPGVSRVDKTAEIRLTFDGNSGTAFIKTQRTDWANFDEYGNAGLVTRSGTDTVSEVTHTEFVTNPSSYIVNRPAHTWMMSNGIKIRERWFAYDQLGENTTPTKGDLTQDRRWLSTGTTPFVRHFYDTYGNRVGTINSLNHVCPTTGYTTVTAYDALYKTMPAVEVNALCQQITKQYDGLTLGLVRDENGVATEYQHDPLHRLSAVITPPDTAAAPTTQYAYYWNGTAPEGTLVRQRQTVGGGTIRTYTFVDGFGRTIQTRTEAGADSHIVVDTTYNARGLVETVSAPYFGDESSDYVPPPNPPAPKTTMLYDPAGRLIKVNNTDGTYSTRIYDHWSTTFIDPSGHKRVETHDAFGRLTKVVEYAGADNRDPDNYSWESYTPYASTTIGYGYTPNGHQEQTATNRVGLGGTVTSTTKETFDSLGRRIQSDDPDLGTRVYAYDSEGNLLRETDAKQQVTSYVYDPLGRVLVKTTGSSTDSQAPAKPGLAAAPTTLPEIVLTWSGLSSDVVAVLIERCHGSGCSAFAPIAGATGTTHTDINLLGATSYTYRIRAMDAAGNLGTYSDPASAVTPTAPHEWCPEFGGANGVCSPGGSLNIGGSSAAAELINHISLSVLPIERIQIGENEELVTPIHYVNGPITVGTTTITSGSLHVWTGTRQGYPTVIRYAAADSMQGITRLQQPTTDPNSNMLFLDHRNPTSCTDHMVRTRASDGREYHEYTGCTATVSLPVNLGASDVHGSSFHQTGPLTVTVVPIDQSFLLSTQVVVVPFKIVLGKGVKRVDPVSGALLDVDSLSRPKIEALLSRQVTDWRKLGLVADADADGVEDSEAPVVLCLQQAGSGAKAALDEILMKDAVEMPLGSAPTALNHTHTAGTGHVHFGLSALDVRDCIGGNAALNRPPHPAAIGYLSADAVVPNGYGAGIDGRQARDLALADPKTNVKCGKYPFWTGLRLNHRNPSDPDVVIQSLIDEFITKASDPATIALMSTADYWMATSELYVFKNADHGPILWKALSELPPGQTRFPCGE